MSTPSYSSAGRPRRVTVNRYNQRMAARVARRAHLDEPAVAIAFTFNSMLTWWLFGLVEECGQIVPVIGDLLGFAISLLSFYFHRIVIVTAAHVYVYRDWPLHYPSKQLAAFERGPGVVRIGTDDQNWFRRGELTFNDGTVVYHGPIWIRRAEYIAQEGNIPKGQ